MKKKLIGGIIILFVVSAYLIFIFNRPDNSFKLNDNTLSYSKNRGLPQYELKYKTSNGSIDIYTLNFKSKDFQGVGTQIHGLLFMPKNKKNVPGLILLLGGGVPKEGEARLGLIIAEQGYAVYTFDQRGIGETGGTYLDLNNDYKAFSEGYEPIQYLSVYDALAAFDVLRDIKNINHDNIAIAGESMGGRYSMIAAAIDKRLKGVIVISSSGFHVAKTTEPYIPYLISVDPDHYVSDISPNKFFMLHGSNDSMIKLNDAKITFALAKEPKRFFVAQDCGHGYCDKMDDELANDLEEMFR